MTPDAAPQRNWSNVTRAEARTANPALALSAALGANFRLDGTTNLNANYVVAYLVIPACPAKDAYELAVAMNGAQLHTVEGAHPTVASSPMPLPPTESRTSMFISRPSEPRTVLLWGDRWWFAGSGVSAEFADLGGAVEVLVAHYANEPKPVRIRLIFQPDALD